MSDGGRLARALARVEDRPDPKEWDDDEPLTLPEAATLFWPRGPIKTHTLRTAAKEGTLSISVVAGKFFTTPRAVREMTSRPRAIREVDAARPGEAVEGGRTTKMSGRRSRRPDMESERLAVLDKIEGLTRGSRP